MAESFSAALKRYIHSGYKAPEAMRAVWQDVKVGRVARPARRRRVVYSPGTSVAASPREVRAMARAALRRNPELTGEQHQVLNAWARYGPTHWLRKVKGGWVDELPPIVGSFPTVWKTKREAAERVNRLILLRAREWRGQEPESNPRRSNPAGVELIQFRADGHVVSLGRFPTFRRAATHARRQQRLYPEDEFEIKGQRGRRRYIAPAPTATGVGRLVGLVGPMRPPRRNPVTLTARAAGTLARADPAVRRLPRVGWCVRLSDGRELCHDRRGYYLVGAGRQARMTTYGSKRSRHAEYLEADVGRGNPSRKMAEYQARLDRQVSATRQRRAIAGGAPARELLYYAYARRPDGVIAQLLVRRAGGAQVSQTWTGVTYRNVREAEADVVRRNAQMYAHRRPSTVQARRTAMKLTARGINPARPSYQAYCLTCLGGGKALGRPTTSKRAAEREATSHMSAYGHPVTITRPGRNPRGRHNPMMIDPIAKLKTLRRIVGEHQAMRIGAEGQVDATTAHAILTVYDALAPANQQKYLAMPVRRMADVAWKLLARKNPTIVPGKRIRTWGGWYRHDVVMEQGKEIGRIQVRRRPGSKRFPGRIDVLTTERGGQGGVVLGQDVEWLVRRARERGEINPRRRRFGRNQPLTVSDPQIRAFLAAWHEDGRAAFERSYRNLDYDSPAYQHVARDRRKYIALDQGTGGVFLVDKATGDVFTIKGYGVPNRRVGTLAQVTARYQAGQAPPRGFERYQGNPRRRRQAGAWGSMGLVPRAARPREIAYRGLTLRNRSGRRDGWSVTHNGRVRWGTLAEVKQDVDAVHMTGYLPQERVSWNPRRRSRRPFRNPAAGFETFDLADRAGWERAIRTAGGLRVSKAERRELAEVPGYLKGYRRGVAPDELAQMIADERGLPARDVERAMLAAFHGPRRRAATLESVDYERLEREAIQLEGAGRARGGESRPRVRVGLDVFTLRPRSPFKGSIHHVNPPRPRGTLIYDRLLELRARKGRRSHYPLERFKHGFKPGAQVIGLPSGDVLLHGARGQRLWQHVEA